MKLTQIEQNLFNRKKAMLSSNVQVWRTPKDFYDKLNLEFKFDFDPCPINEQFDGLSIEWGNSNFVNPPFKDKDKWIKKSYQEWVKGKNIVMLLPVRGTDTKIFHEFVIGNAEIRFVKGRLVFDNVKGEKGKYPAPFPTMLIIFKNKLVK
jgi:site-specific DNA-methyltransferase (adenine-specific)